MCLNNLTVSRKTSEALRLLLWPQQTLSHINNLSLIPLLHNLASDSTGLKDKAHLNTRQTCP